MIRLLLTLTLAVSAMTAQADTMRLAVTTSFQNSGLADELLPAIRRDTGHDIQVLVVGTGQALRLGAAGDVDAVLVHAKSSELAHIQAGHAPYRREVMYNDFVILGPQSDPAGVAKAETAAAAFSILAQGDTRFASRGDDSGTHKAERAIWEASGNAPSGSWYIETGAGMGATLNTAVGLGAYVMADRASWLNFGNKSDFEILFEGDVRLFNQYAFLPTSAEKHPHIDGELAKSIESWLTGPTGQGMIGAYRVDGVQVFFPNANDQTQQSNHGQRPKLAIPTCPRPPVHSGQRP